jgi:hypothetical protein
LLAVTNNGTAYGTAISNGSRVYPPAKKLFATARIRASPGKLETGFPEKSRSIEMPERKPLRSAAISL